jgi:A/G-specific adenine glycosylase
MDLGSQVCTSVTPQCAACPVQRFCTASALGLAERFPEKAKKPAAVEVDHVSVVLRSGVSVAVTQCPADGRWANLWEFPRVERRKGESLKAAAQRALALIPNAAAQVTRQRLVIRHGIMHYRVTLYCYDASFRPGALPKLPAHAALQWIDIARLGELPFSSPQRKIVRHLEQEASEKGANEKPHQPDRLSRS